MGNIHALKEYNKVNLESGVENASPHRLIQMLIDGALAKISQAKGHMQANATGKKGEAISMAISIIGGLRDSLDHKKGGDIAENLDSLYEYMSVRLYDASMNKSAEPVEEVIKLLREVKAGWDGIAQQAAEIYNQDASPVAG